MSRPQTPQIARWMSSVEMLEMYIGAAADDGQGTDEAAAMTVECSDYGEAAASLRQCCKLVMVTDVSDKQHD
eukprot:6482107-Amphidinium_carterae.1